MRGGPSRRGLIITSIVGLVAVTSMALVAPVGAKDAFERRIRRAAEATVEAGTARVALQIAIDSGVVSGDRHRRRRVSSRATWTAVIDLSELTGAAASFEERIVDGVIYIDFGSILDATGSVLPAELLGKRWDSVDIFFAHRPRRGEPSEHRPHRWGEPHVAAGCAARHRRRRARVGRRTSTGPDDGTAVVRSASRGGEHLDAVPDAPRAQVEAGLEQMFRGDRKLPVDLWLDAENRLRQMRTVYRRRGARAGTCHRDARDARVRRAGRGRRAAGRGDHRLR